MNLSIRERMQTGIRERKADMNGQGYEDPMKRLKDAGINTEAGLKYCGMSEMFYLKVLEEFCGNREKKIKDLEALYSAENWKSYGVSVHALKSGSRLIGADALSEEARILELAAKAGKLDTVRERHPGFMKDYEATLRLIASVCGEPEEEKPVEDEEIMEFGPGGGDI